jgi:bacterioferritin-associated ferredoxin
LIIVLIRTIFGSNDELATTREAIRMYVCVCNGVTDKEIRRAVERGHDSLDSLRSELQVASCCGRCANCARSLIESTLAERAPLYPEVSFA